MDVVAHAPAQQIEAEDDLARVAFAAAPGGLLVIENGRVLLANSVAAKLLGYDAPASVVSLPIEEFFPGGLVGGDPSQDDSGCGHRAQEWNLQRAGQEPVRVKVRAKRLRSGERNLLLAAFEETSNAELASIPQNGETRFREIFEVAAIGIGTCTMDGRIIESNPALGKMLAYGSGELTGMHLREFHPGDFCGEDSLLRQLNPGMSESFDLDRKFRRKDGAWFWGHVAVSLVRDEGGNPAFAIFTIEDITERKKNEDQLREAEKLEVIGRVAGGIAHDFNNLLTGILLYCDLVLTGPEPEEQLRAHVEEIRLAGEQGAALTQQLLSLARKQTPQPRPIRLNDVIASTENLLRRLIGEQVELVIEPAPNLEPVMADPGQLRQVLLNLVLNARDAMPNGGRITVSTQRRTAPADGGAAISLMVSDTGDGMDPETRSRLFEPFFTTKQPGQGTGLGMSTVQRIVKESGGRITVESEIGQGTRIEVLFPALIFPAAASVPEASQKTGETILLVDDHAGARHSMQRVLHQAGYRVLPASSGKRGLALFAEHESEVELLIADWMMPGMSGRELAKRLRGRKPGLKILLISGYQDGHDEPGAQSVDLIRKPFAGSALLGRIREVLDSRGERPC